MARFGEDPLEHILEQLSEYGGPQKTNNDWINVSCPHHTDNNPSCGIMTNPTNPRFELGWYSCFSCGNHGTWNDFAEAANLKPLSLPKSNAPYAKSMSKSEIDSMFGADPALSHVGILRDLGHPEAQPWSKNLDWRGFDGSFLHSLGAYMVDDKHNDDIAALFVVKIAGRIRGGVKAIYRKRYQSQAGYITTKGEWISKYGLLLYDQVRTLLKKTGYRFVVLVEGPRDALALFRLGIPALAILGANNFTKAKLQVIEALNVHKIYVISDNDNGGTKMWNRVHKLADNAKRLKLPVEYDRHGELIKMDPFNAPYYVKANLIEYLADNEGFDYDEAMDLLDKYEG